MQRPASALRWLLPALALLGASCKDDGSAAARRCDRPFTGSELEGQWVLRADGERGDCSNRRLEGELSFKTSMDVRVETEAIQTTGPATGSEADFPADAFVDRIERADFVVTPAARTPAELEISGSVTGACFQVILDEELPDGDHLRYRLDGYITGRGRARGDFTGSGPGDCTSKGSFTLDVD